MYADCTPPDLVAPVSPSAERIAAIEKDLWRVEGPTRASLVICVRSMFLFGNVLIDLRVGRLVTAGDDSFLCKWSDQTGTQATTSNEVNRELGDFSFAAG